MSWKCDICDTYNVTRIQLAMCVVKLGLRSQNVKAS